MQKWTYSYSSIYTCDIFVDCDISCCLSPCKDSIGACAIIHENEILLIFIDAVIQYGHKPTALEVGSSLESYHQTGGGCIGANRCIGGNWSGVKRGQGTPFWRNNAWLEVHAQFGSRLVFQYY